MFTASSLRRRTVAPGAVQPPPPPPPLPPPPAPALSPLPPPAPTADPRPARPSYFLVRVLYLRLLGLVFFAAFAAALLQNQALIGSHGLAPACAAARLPPAPARSLAELWPRARAARAQPSLFWLVGCSDDSLAAVALAGAAAALVPLLLGACNIVLLLVLWACQISFVNLGSFFYAFGWETQLLETALWTVVALPLVSLSAFDAELAPSSVAFALVSRALIGKIMLGAGMIKIRGDACWRDLWNGASCMQAHYETQPSPNPLSAAFHFGFFGLSERLGLDARAVELWHGFETMTNHVVELGVPLLLLPFLPRLCRVAAGVALVGFQLVLIASGNLALLNHLTILPALFAFDDAAVSPLFSAAMRARASAAAAQADVLAAELWAALCRQQPRAAAVPRTKIAGYCARNALAGAALVAYAALQAPVVQNLLSARQAMNRSFGAWHLSNTYGAFGSVGKVRNVVSLVGYGDDGVARAYEFPCHPGALSRRPCVIAPYHLRADWLAWFAGLEGMTYQHYPFIVHLVDELLSGKPLHRPTARSSLVGALRELMPALLATDARDVLSHDPFRGAAAPPRSVAVLLFEYRFTPPGLARALQRLRLPAAAPAPEIDAVALGSELCAAVPAAWAWRVGSASCSAQVSFADDGSGAYVEVSSAGGVKFEVGAVWARRQRGSPWLPALERGNPSVRAFLDAQGWRE